MNREEVKGVQIRFPLPLYKKLKVRAKESIRSFNSEVIVCLERLFAAEEAILEARRGKEDV